MKTQFIKPDDIPSMQQHLIEQSAAKEWECIQKGLEQYLGKPLDETTAPNVEIRRWPDGKQDIYYLDNLVGTITGEWQNTDVSMKYVWTYTPKL